jgi:hypothetical protein
MQGSTKPSVWMRRVAMAAKVAPQFDCGGLEARRASYRARARSERLICDADHQACSPA